MQAKKPSNPGKDVTQKTAGNIISINTCLISLVFGIFIFVLAVFIILSIGKPGTEAALDSLAQLTVIPAPTVTPTVPVPLETPNLEVRYVSAEGFSVGAFVQIANTQGAGLKIRPEPGTSGDVSFIASDGDLFTIVDGPDDRNGYSWWKLQGVNDKALSGWGASAFLSLVAPAADQVERKNP